MSVSPPKTSVLTKFPEGSGDFRIKSSDGLIYYFPKAILAYVSPVFRDMFTIPADGQDASTSPDIVDVTEPGNIMELFLEHLDPVRETPPIDPENIDALLDMADKYQVTAIIKWFEKEITIQQMHGTGEVTRQPMLLTDPSKVLQIAQRFNLEHPTRLAIRELLQSEIQFIIDDSISISTTKAIIRLRETRTTRYYGWIEQLASPRRRTVTYYDEEYTQQEREEDDDKYVTACIQCTSNRAKWVLGMMQAVRESPKWEVFDKAFYNGSYCDDCGLSWSEHFEELYSSWEERAGELERLDNLPSTLDPQGNWLWREF